MANLVSCLLDVLRLLETDIWIYKWMCLCPVSVPVSSWVEEVCAACCSSFRDTVNPPILSTVMTKLWSNHLMGSFPLTLTWLHIFSLINQIKNISSTIPQWWLLSSPEGFRCVSCYARHIMDSISFNPSNPPRPPHQCSSDLLEIEPWRGCPTSRSRAAGFLFRSVGSWPLWRDASFVLTSSFQYVPAFCLWGYNCGSLNRQLCIKLPKGNTPPNLSGFLRLSSGGASSRVWWALDVWRCLSAWAWGIEDQTPSSGVPTQGDLVWEVWRGRREQGMEEKILSKWPAQIPSDFPL